MSISPRRQYGVTLVELVISMVIIGVAAAGILQLINLTASSSTDPIRRKQALLIAEGLMDEVLSGRFTFCEPTDANADRATVAALAAVPPGVPCATTLEVLGPEAGNARPFDNVNDYYAAGSFSFNNGVGQLVNANGLVMPGIGYQASVTINPVIPNGASLGPAAAPIISANTPPNMNALLITMRVRFGPRADDVVVLDAYRTRYAPTTF